MFSNALRDAFFGQVDFRASELWAKWTWPAAVAAGCFASDAAAVFLASGAARDTDDIIDEMDREVNLRRKFATREGKLISQRPQTDKLAAKRLVALLPRARKRDVFGCEL